MENQPFTQDPIADARLTCRELMALLAEENAGLIRHDVTLIESRLSVKKRLTMRLEQLMKEIKLKSPVWKTTPQGRNQAYHLAEEVQHFQKLARQNASMLEAAQQLRADLVVAIRDAVDEQTPKARLYTAGGYVQQLDGATRLVAREA